MERRGLKIVLIVILVIFAAPIALPLAIGLAGGALGLIISLLAAALALCISAVAFLASGIVAIVTLPIAIFTDLTSVLSNAGYGMIAIGLGILLIKLVLFAAKNTRSGAAHALNRISKRRNNDGRQTV